MCDALGRCFGAGSGAGPPANRWANLTSAQHALTAERKDLRPKAILGVLRKHLADLALD